MTELVWGQPVVGGETVPISTKVVFYKVTSDGTRRVVEYHGRSALVDPHVPIGQSIDSRSTRIVPLEYAGFIPIRITGEVLTPKEIHPLDLAQGRWIGFPDETGTVPLQEHPTTPGTDFYRLRHILDEHAHRFRTEHNAATMIYETMEHRIEHIAHELSPEDRLRAGNVSLKIRSDIGQLWRRVHRFAKMPYGTTETDVAWRAERDAIGEEMAIFCDLCAGSGLSGRVVKKHPHVEWKNWLDNGIRFAVDRQFVARQTPNSRWLDDPVIDYDISNYNEALDHFREGHVDDDFGGDGLNTRSQVIPPSLAAALTPVAPSFTGNHALWRAAHIGYWRREAQWLRYNPKGSYFQKRIFFWFAAANIIALLRDINIEGITARGFLQVNRQDVTARAILDGNAFSDLGTALFAHYYGTTFTDLASQVPWFARHRILHAPDTVIVSSPIQILTIPPNELDANDSWLPVPRAAMASRLESILEFPILGEAGQPLDSV